MLVYLTIIRVSNCIFFCIFFIMILSSVLCQLLFFQIEKKIVMLFSMNYILSRSVESINHVHIWTGVFFFFVLTKPTLAFGNCVLFECYCALYNLKFMSQLLMPVTLLDKIHNDTTHQHITLTASTKPC